MQENSFQNPFQNESVEDTIASINRNIKASRDATEAEREFSHDDDHLHRKGPHREPPIVERGNHLVGGGGYKGRHHRMDMALRQARNVQMIKM